MRGKPETGRPRDREDTVRPRATGRHGRAGRGARWMDSERLRARDRDQQSDRGRDRLRGNGRQTQDRGRNRPREDRVQEPDAQTHRGTRARNTNT